MTTLNILSLGAGVQSTTLLLMSCRGVLPKLDCAIFADTSWESQVTYRHLEWLTEEAASSGIPVHRVNGGNLRGATMTAQVRGTKAKGERYASLPLFVLHEDGRGMIKRQCSREYKIRPIEHFTRRELLGLKPRQHVPAGVHVSRWMGISSDEMRRARMTQSYWETATYPLLGLPKKMLDRPYSRMMCVDWVKKNYPGREVPRSACVGCPFHSNAEWRATKANPAEWKDVCEVDDAIRHCAGMRGEAFLHQSCVPLRKANLDEDQASMFGEECLGVCNT